MRRIAIPGLLSILVLSSSANAQSGPKDEPTSDGVALGFAVHRFQDDFGLSGLVASPAFAGDSLRVAGAGGIAWYPHGVDANAHEAWEAYGHGRLVLEAGAKLRGAPMRLYGFGGVTAIFPPDSLSSEPIYFGGVGGFGFEFLFRHAEGDGPVRYFIELGGIGTTAVADRLATEPRFANGFFVATGLAVYP